MFIEMENIDGTILARRTRDLQQLVHVVNGEESFTKVYFNGRDSYIAVKDDFFELIRRINKLEEKKHDK